MRVRTSRMMAVTLWCAVILCSMWPALAGGEVAAARGDSQAEGAGETWKKSLIAGANFSQTSFSHWAQGGENFLAWTFTGQGALERMAGVWNWKTSLELEYGFIRRGDEDTRKSVDQILLESVGTRSLTEKTGLFAAAGLRTQFSLGRDYSQEPPVRTSRFADPLYLTQSIGLNHKPAPGLATRLGLALQEVRTDVYRQYSDDPETSELEDLKVETGITSVTAYEGILREGVHIQSKLGLFYSFEQTDELDIDWNSALKIELTRHISVDYDLQIIYDEDVQEALGIAPRAQIKQFLGLGISLAIL